MKSARYGKGKLDKDVILYCAILSALYIFILLMYGQIRLFFPKPTSAEVVGFAQYFGYPLYFDNFIFLIIILCPIFTFMIKRIIRRYL